MENSKLTIKEIAIEFLHLTASGHARKAFISYAAPDFKHHNVYFKGDALSLMTAMEENSLKFPNTELIIQRALCEGDTVAIHSHVKLIPEEPGYSIMHIFRFQNNQIAELWDFGQAVPAEMINENGMF